MVIIEERRRVVAKAACPSEPRDIEDLVDRSRVVTPKFGQHEAPRVLLPMLAVLLPNPSDAADGLVISRRRLASAPSDHLDVLARGADNPEDLVDAGVRIGPTIVLSARQPFERHRRPKGVVLKDRRRCVVNSRVYGKNKLSHLRLAVIPNRLRDAIWHRRSALRQRRKTAHLGAFSIGHASHFDQSCDPRKIRPPGGKPAGGRP